MKNYPAVVGTDPEIELRDGDMKFTFAITNKPVIRYGDRRIVPNGHGFAIMSMVDGRWTASSVQVNGHHAKVRSDEPTRKEATISYSFGSGTPSEGDLDTWHPGYAPPPWLITFITGFIDRLDGRTGEKV